MSQPQHTPGPWTADVDPHFAYYDEAPQFNDWRVIRAGDQQVIFPAYARIARCGATEIDAGVIISEADANLIAAAPDLLEALQAVRSLLQRADVRIEARDVAWFTADSVFERADAAIAKALGQEVEAQQ